MSGQRGRAKSGKIDRMEKDTAKLTALYNEGYAVAEKIISNYPQKDR